VAGSGTPSAVRATKAYIASLGTTGLLLASSLLVLTLTSALVTFEGWPGAAADDSVRGLVLDGGGPLKRASGAVPAVPPADGRDTDPAQRGARRQAAERRGEPGERPDERAGGLDAPLRSAPQEPGGHGDDPGEPAHGGPSAGTAPGEPPAGQPALPAPPALGGDPGAAIQGAADQLADAAPELAAPELALERVAGELKQVAGGTSR
jgi:hypothetical protein